MLLPTSENALLLSNPGSPCKCLRLLQNYLDLVTLDNREPQPHPIDVSNEAGKVLQLTLVKSMDDGL